MSHVYFLTEASFQEMSGRIKGSAQLINTPADISTLLPSSKAKKKGSRRQHNQEKGLIFCEMSASGVIPGTRHRLPINGNTIIPRGSSVVIVAGNRVKRCYKIAA